MPNDDSAYFVEDTRQLAVVPEKPSDSIDKLIVIAMQSNAPTETLKDLLSMRSQLRAEYAEEQYNAAFAELQANMPTIKKTKKGAVGYYAPLDSIVAQVKPLLLKYGFSYQFKQRVDYEEGQRFTVQICVVRHVAGHKEEIPYTSRNMPTNKATNDAQADGGTNTYTKRYCFCNAFGIMTGDEDTDGAQKREYMTAEQYDELLDCMRQTGHTEADVLKVCKVNAISEVTTQQATAVIAQLQRIIAKHTEESKHE